MPVRYSKDSKGCYAQWGDQKKYYYECGNEAARKRAGHKAHLQGAAIEGNEAMNVLHMLVANLTAEVRYETLENKTYMVVPMVMMTEGVHNGTGGPLFYSASELGKTPVMWNHKPIVVYHPTSNGNPVSACDPTILNNRKIGLIMNAGFDDSKLKAEAWLDAERTAKVDSRIIDAIEKKEMTEVSIGVYIDVKKEEGDWHEEHYDGVAEHLRPDHLAILPDQIGACSIEDGAGLLRVNELSHAGVRDLLFSYLRDKGKEDAWIDDVYDGFFVYSEGGKLYKQNYSQSDNKIEVTGDPVEVVRVIEYRTLDGTYVGNAVWTTAYINDLPDSAFLYIEPGGKKDGDGKTTPRSLRHFPVKDKNGKIDAPHVRNALARIPQSKVSAAAKKSSIAKAKRLLKKVNANVSNDSLKKGNTMDKEKLVDSLIDSTKTPWAEEDRDFLMEHDEKWLSMFVPNEETDTPPKDDDKPEPEANKKKDVTTQPKVTDPEEETVEQYVAKAPEVYRRVLRSSLAAYNEQVAKNIETIMANANNTFTKEHLLTKDLEELQALAKLAEQPATEHKTKVVPLYFGQAQVVNEQTDKMKEGLALPAMDFSKQKTG